MQTVNILKVSVTTVTTKLPSIITIDGPAGAGKSTLGELLAQRLGYLYFDTGVMYRALTLAVLQADIHPDDADAIAALAEQLDIRVEQPTVADTRQYTVLLNGNDVTWDIRSPEVERKVSQVSRHPTVRTVMRARQREIGLLGRVVMVGRDIGTMVMPDAACKIFLQTSVDERTRRRAEQIRDQGKPVDFDTVAQDVKRRDALDQHVSAPASDAFVLQTDELSPEDEVASIMAHFSLSTE